MDYGPYKAYIIKILISKRLVYQRYDSFTFELPNAKSDKDCTRSHKVSVGCIGKTCNWLRSPKIGS